MLVLITMQLHLINDALIFIFDFIFIAKFYLVTIILLPAPDLVLDLHRVGAT